MKLLWTFVWASTVLSVQGFGNETYDDCDASSYYSELPAEVADWTRELLNGLLYTTHRTSLNMTNSEDPGTNDVWGALMDIDVGEEPGTIRLVYTDDEIPQIPFGERGWVREHLHPLSRGVGTFGPDRTDLHNLRAATSLSETVRDEKYFGECGVLSKPETCVAPAEGGAEDTCVCDRAFTPPANLKGDIARALMYMDLRYDGSEYLTLDLRLTDCPFQRERDMAYLSQMLTWHMEDPPDEWEISRNQKVCENWQGNRNPFVDYPELAEQLWGEPLALPAVGERLIYEACEALPTLAPTYIDNECDLLEDGDITIWLMNSQSPANVGFYSFVALPAEFELFVTDNPWDGESFVELPGAESYDGTLKFTVGSSALSGGAIFGWGDDIFPRADQFSVVQGNFTPSTEGEPLFIYCYSASGAQKPLLVFANGDDLFVDTGLEDYNETQSALPKELSEDGIIHLPYYMNLLYNGPGSDELEVDQLKVAVRDPVYWEGSNEYQYGFDRSSGSSTRGTRSTSWIVPSVVTTMMLMALGGNINNNNNNNNHHLIGM
eukprot:Nitzschia sp. Nitz4//scaffold136_size62208//30526//32251//NITZ4_006370-RA/size62208-augustus-gene-0.7-mRNA-1//-1//CDS//3329535624//2361//frame0